LAGESTPPDNELNCFQIKALPSSIAVRHRNVTKLLLRAPVATCYFVGDRIMQTLDPPRFSLRRRPRESVSNASAVIEQRGFPMYISEREAAMRGRFSNSCAIMMSERSTSSAI
jgi:hypothetical protein